MRRDAPSFTFCSYDARVRVDLPRDVAIDALEPYLAPQMTGRAGGRGLPDVWVEREGKEASVCIAKRSFGPYSDRTRVLRALANAIHYVAAIRSPMTFVHSGAVEIGGAAVLFPGRSRWGKSTLVATLVELGCGYLSDEYAVLSSEGTVFPFSKPIRRRSPEGDSYLSPPGVAAPGGLVCAGVFLTRYREGATWDPSPLSAGFATLQMLPYALRSYKAPEQVVPALTALTETAARYEGARGEALPMAAAVLATMMHVNLRGMELRA